jgi:hypothetical protein
MAKMDMKMGAHALKYRPKKDERFKIKEEYGMQMDMSKDPANERNGHESFRWKEYIKRSKMDMPKDPAKEGMEMDHSKMEGMKRTTCKKKL